MSILIMGDKQFADHLQATLSNHKIYSVTSNCLNSAGEQLKQSHSQLVICTLPFGQDNCGEHLLNYLQEKSPTSNIIFIAEDIEVWNAIELVKKGLFTCLKRPFLIEDLISQVNNCISPVLEKTKEKIKKLIPEKYIKGTSNVSEKMYEQIDLVGPTNFNVIIYGETGTGKESVAKRLTNGDESLPFVAVDCSCLSKELAASELFGHEKGAFTGAVDVKKGVFEQAQNGTVFLDEIGNLQYEVQTYLLRAIQERKIRKVGSNKEVNIKVRILVASNENLWEKVKKGEFREDLYHRLNEFEISIPPLRDRKEDIHLFIDGFIDQGNHDLNKNITGIDADAFKILYDHQWPGNIRELKNVVRRACLNAQSDHITSGDLPHEFSGPSHDNRISGGTEADHLRSKPSEYIKILTKKIEMDQIMEVLKSVNYNKTKAALLLNINRRTLYNKLRDA